MGQGHEIGQASVRGESYRLLAPLFLPPDESLITPFRSGEYAQALEFCWKALGLMDEVGLLRHFRTETESLSLDHWWQEYAHSLGHTAAKDCPPYETQYGTAHVFMQAQTLADIAAFYRAFGLEVRSGTERFDHIAVELEFMGFLCLKEAYGLSQGHEDERIRSVREAQRRFLRAHLGRWGLAFCRLLRRRAGTGFYALSADLTLTFLTHEMKALGVTIPETDLQPVTGVWLPGCFACPLADS